MAKKETEQLAEQELKALEYRVDDLITTIDRLAEENRTLREHQESLVTDRARLIEKNDLVRTRVESMIHRLKGMEHSA